MLSSFRVFIPSNAFEKKASYQLVDFLINLFLDLISSHISLSFASIFARVQSVDVYELRTSLITKNITFLWLTLLLGYK